MPAIVVECLFNRLSDLNDSAVRQRLSQDIHLDGPDSDLTVGRNYTVHAIEARRGAWWFYIHSVAVSNFPYPYPAEYFRIVSNVVPAEWRIYPVLNEGEFEIKRLSFTEWATNDTFYEKLVDGDPNSLMAYERARTAYERLPVPDGV